MKKIIAVLAVFLLVGLPCIAVESDADNPEVQKVKWCKDTLYHFTGTALEDWTVTGMIWIYPEGEDSQMKKYIADPQNNDIVDGITDVKEGVTYEVYYYEDEPWDFVHEGSEIALEPYIYKIFVKQQSVVKLKIDSIKAGKFEYTSYDVIYEPKGSPSVYGYIGIWSTLNYVDDHGYYVLDRNYGFAPYAEAEIQIVVKEFHGSPYLYIGLCIGITALVALLIAVCGRKPKL
ncbi:MAG: hypothetical protein IKQ93_06855 [Candidatus Methanomethylophilaceae archaeon]|nr:hypothetical protein [Candidatus Methanomethylophilaceae archaeon]MBR6910579.1 hypothetical protein [Candidatus Methanomethylophilaceae archaeon]